MIDMSIAELEAEMAVVLPDREVMHHGIRFVRNNVVVLGHVHQWAFAANAYSDNSSATATNAIVITQNSGDLSS